MTECIIFKWHKSTEYLAETFYGKIFISVKKRNGWKDILITFKSHGMSIEAKLIKRYSSPPTL